MTSRHTDLCPMADLWNVPKPSQSWWPFSDLLSFLYSPKDISRLGQNPQWAEDGRCTIRALLRKESHLVLIQLVNTTQARRFCESLAPLSWSAFVLTLKKVWHWHRRTRCAHWIQRLDQTRDIHFHHTPLQALWISLSSICISSPCSLPSFCPPDANIMALAVGPWLEVDVKPNAVSMSLPRLPWRSRA